MKAEAVSRAGATLEALEGRVLCHDVRDAAGKVSVAKGTRLDRTTAERLLAAPWEEVHLITLGPGDLHEEDAGRRLVASLAGAGVAVKGYAGGQWSLAAAHRGLLRVEVPSLARANAHEGVSIFTLWDLQPVEADEVVARAKVSPLVIAESTVQAVERLARSRQGLLAVRAFQRRTIGAMARDNLTGRQRDKFEAALRQKIDWFGSDLCPVRYAGGSAPAVAEAVSALRADGADLLVVAGASTLDPLDPVFGGLALLGVQVERQGVPAHPGSLLWLGWWADTAVLGMPTCGMFSEATTFDLVLPRLLTGERVDNAVLADLGHGGLLSRDMAYRFPPYRANTARGEVE